MTIERYQYDSPPDNDGDFSVGAQVYPPPAATPSQPLRVQRYAQTTWRLARYLQYWIERELGDAWASELAAIGPQPDGSLIGTELCPIVPASFVPIEQWNLSAIAAFPHLNVIRPSMRAVMESTELAGMLNNYACGFILPPATSLDLADLFAQMCSAVADVVIGAMARNTIDGENRWFTTENKLEESVRFGKLQTPASAENWLNVVSFDIQIRQTIYKGTAADNAMPYAGTSGTLSTPIGTPTTAGDVFAVLTNSDSK